MIDLTPDERFLICIDLMRRHCKRREDFRKKYQKLHTWLRKTELIGGGSALELAYQRAGLRRERAPRESWDWMKAFTSASNYDTRNAWRVGCRNSFNWATKNRIVNEICDAAGLDYPASGGFNKNKPGLLYFVKLTFFLAEGVRILYKIGVTNSDSKLSNQEKVNARVKSYGFLHMCSHSIVFINEFSSGLEAIENEREILKDYAFLKYQGTRLMQNGNTELLTECLEIQDLYVEC